MKRKSRIGREWTVWVGMVVVVCVYLCERERVCVCKTDLIKRGNILECYGVSR